MSIFVQPEETARYRTMDENMNMAKLARVKDLDPKLIACDPLPDVDRETDLNFFITQWRETKDTDLRGAIE